MTPASWAWILLSCLTAGARAGDDAFSFAAVRERARDLAEREFVAIDDSDLPAWLAELAYEGHRRLRFKEDRALWSGGPSRFRILLFHRGFLFRSRVRVHVVDEGRVQEIAFSPDLFDYRDVPDRGDVPADLGFAGFRVTYPLHGEEKRDEVAAFLGATYFRVLGRHQLYGASARALAIDTAEAKGEEFPVFREFWIERPAPDAASLVVHALLDSPSLAGACRFEIAPGVDTRVECQVALFPRVDIGKLGVAPLTSMFFFGEAGPRHVPDFRPEVHDSDGLAVVVGVSGGDAARLWRPLSNPRGKHRMTRIPADGLLAFGLAQRDRDFDHYQDLEGRYEKRPSLVVRPLDDFGPGDVELVEIPTANEWNDNVVAYFVPRKPLRRGAPARFRYALTASLDDVVYPPRARFVATRIRPEGASGAFFVLDAAGEALEGVSVEELQADVEIEGGLAQDVVVQRNDAAGGVRVTFRLVADGEAAGLRVTLRTGEQALTETWVHPWSRS